MNVTQKEYNVCDIKMDQLGTTCWLVLTPVKSEEGKFAALQRGLHPPGAEGQEGVLRHRLLAPGALLPPEHTSA